MSYGKNKFMRMCQIFEIQHIVNESQRVFLFPIQLGQGMVIAKSTCKLWLRVGKGGMVSFERGYGLVRVWPDEEWKQEGGDVPTGSEK